MAKTLLDELLDGPPEPAKPIEIQRSDLQLHMRCPRWYQYSKQNGDEDHDGKRAALIGIEFHRIMDEYVTHLLAAGRTRDPDELIRMSLDGNPDYQPELTHCAHLTGRVGVWATQYIAHEQKFAYRLPKFGPKGEDVALSCEYDLLMYGDGPGELRIIDWKSGWKKTGFDFQAMFYATVLAHSREGVERVSWQPFFSRFGTWGKRIEFEKQDLVEAEAVVKRAAMELLSDEEFKAKPGTVRCEWCPYTDLCDIAHRGMGIKEDPQAYARATNKLEIEIKQRLKNIEAFVDEYGEFKLSDNEWVGVDIFRKSGKFGIHKGSPRFLGEGEESDDAGHED